MYGLPLYLLLLKPQVLHWWQIWKQLIILLGRLIPSPLLVAICKGPRSGLGTMCIFLGSCLAICKHQSECKMQNNNEINKCKKFNESIHSL